MFVPVSPDTHALSKLVTKFPTVSTKFAKVISKSSVIAFPYPSTFHTCMNDAPTSLASCLMAENVFCSELITCGPFSSHDSLSGSNSFPSVFFIASACSLISLDTSSVVNISSGLSSFLSSLFFFPVVICISLSNGANAFSVSLAASLVSSLVLSSLSA